MGGRRQLDLVPVGVARAERVSWPSPLLPALPGLLAEHAGRRVVVLASGDPLVSGIGSTLIELLGAERVRIHPAVSSVALARARMGWAAESATVISVVGRDLGLVRRALGPGQRLLVLSSDARTPVELATVLTEAGYGSSRLTVLGDLGTDSESRLEGRADESAGLAEASALNVVAVACAAAPNAPVLGWVPGLPDDAYDHDGQLTKRDLRAAALSRLAPVPGELLWDLGAGAGSIAIEWARTHPRCRSVAVDRDLDRAARITANAARLGVPSIEVITGDVADVINDLPDPDAVFLGGGISADVIDRSRERLRAGGRLVAHAVTLETEQLLIIAWQAHGGELVRIGVERMEPLGSLHGWKPARPVVQWSVIR